MGTHSFVCCDACAHIDNLDHHFNYCMYMKSNNRNYETYSENDNNHHLHTINTLLSEKASVYKLSKNQITTFIGLFKKSLNSTFLNKEKPLKLKKVFFAGRLQLQQNDLKEIAIYLGAEISKKIENADLIFTTIKQLKKYDEKKKEILVQCFSIRLLFSLLFKQTTLENSTKFVITKNTEIKEKVCKCHIDSTDDGSNGIPTFYKYLLIFLVEEYGEEKGYEIFKKSIGNIRKYLDNLHCWRGFIYSLLGFFQGNPKNNKQKKKKSDRKVVYLKRTPFLKSLKEYIGKRSVKALNGNSTRATIFASQFIIIPHLILDKPLKLVQDFFNCIKELLCNQLLYQIISTMPQNKSEMLGSFIFTSQIHYNFIWRKREKAY